MSGTIANTTIIAVYA
jgi:hypothetical protein